MSPQNLSGNGRVGSWILTYSGRAYWPADPRADEVNIDDIAHALSQLCRYTGHTTKFYSVAEHSVLVSLYVPPQLALEGLLHDASEAYCADINTPLKRQLPDYRRIEQLNTLAIRQHFELPEEEHELVKQTDTDIIVNEKQQVMRPHGPEYFHQWGNGPGIPGLIIRGWTPVQAEELFLERYFECKRAYVNQKRRG